MWRRFGWRKLPIFFNCKVGSLPFKYLGLPTEENPRKKDTLKPTSKVIRKR